MYGGDIIIGIDDIIIGIDDRNLSIIRNYIDTNHSDNSNSNYAILHLYI